MKPESEIGNTTIPYSNYLNVAISSKGLKKLIGKTCQNNLGTTDLQTQQSIQNQSDNLYDIIAKSIVESSQAMIK